MLKIVRDNPLTTLEFLNRNAAKFSKDKIDEIKARIVTTLDEDGREYLRRKALESEYVNYQMPCEANGNTVLDIDKLEAVVSYFAKNVKDLYKVKLMKMLWYADSLCYKKYKKAMTGLVYIHEAMGALPIGHYQIVGLERIRMQEEESDDNTCFHFFPNDTLDMSCLTDNDRNILNRVIDKFGSMTATMIVKYMHKETAYKNTKDKEIIPFSLAGEIRDF